MSHSWGRAHSRPRACLSPLHLLHCELGVWRRASHALPPWAPVTSVRPPLLDSPGREQEGLRHLWVGGRWEHGCTSGCQEKGVYSQWVTGWEVGRWVGRRMSHPV